MAGDLTLANEYLKSQGVIDSRGRLRVDSRVTAALPGRRDLVPGAKVDARTLSSAERFELARKLGDRSQENIRGVGESGERATSYNREVQPIYDESGRKIGEKLVPMQTAQPQAPSPKPIQKAQTNFKPQDPRGIYAPIEQIQNYQTKEVVQDGRVQRVTEFEVATPKGTYYINQSTPVIYGGQKRLKSKSALLQQNESISSRSGNLVGSSNNSSDVPKLQKEVAISSKESIWQGIIEYPKSLVAGGAKLQSYVFEKNGVSNSGRTLLDAVPWLKNKVSISENRLQTKGSVLYDSDVQNLAANVALLIPIIKYPKLNFPLAGYGYYVSSQKIKEYSETGNKKSLGEAIFAGTVSTIPFIKPLKNFYLKTGSKYVPPEEVFAGEVLQGKQTFPTVKNVQENIVMFEQSRNAKGQLVVQSSTSNKFARSAEVEAGSRGAQNLEDTGLYVTPAKKGSPYFLRISKVDSPEYSVSIFPKSNNPNVVRVTVPGKVSQIPKEVLATEGFADVNAYIRGQSGSGDVIIPKRTEARFDPELYATLKNVPTKNKVSGELQAVIPEGAQLKNTARANIIARIKGYNEYTIYEGEVVPIRDYAYVAEGASKQSGKSALAEAKKFTEQTEYYYRNSAKKQVDVYKAGYGSSIKKVQIDVQYKAPVYDGSSKTQYKPKDIPDYASKISKRYKDIEYYSPEYDKRGGSSVNYKEFTYKDSKINYKRSDVIRYDNSYSSKPIKYNSYTGSSNIKYEQITDIRRNNSRKPPNQQIYAKGFDVFVKSRGKFIKVNRQAIPKMSAYDLGYKVVGETAAATFLIRPSNKQVIVRGSNRNYRRDLYKFRTKKSKTGEILNIERNKFRIDTKGEFRGITVEGWLSKRRKRRF